MFRQILQVQWKWGALPLALGAVAAFALPILSVQGFGTVAASHLDAVRLLDAMQSWSVAYPVLAGAVGLVAALTAWGHDHRGRHVYALTLPVARWRYALFRFGAGALLIVPTVAALWVGALMAGAASTVPVGLHVYAGALALRFGIATLLTYAFFFAVASGTSRTAGAVLGSIAVVVVVQVLLNVAGVHTTFLPTVLQHVYAWPGPFELLTGRWMLINV